MRSNIFKDKIILVTGGAGSIGRELINQLLKFDPKVVRALDNNETGLFYLEQSYGTEHFRPFVGDIRDSERLNLALEDVDFVFHAAALKHVPLCENNPFEAIKTNSLGTQNLIQAARTHNVKKFITISTDKAINPTNVMGATKLLAERLTIAANLYIGYRDISFSVVRFGNVLGSRGSVIPLFIRQIREGGPVTVTDPKMTRFIMKTEDAVKLVLEAASISKGGEIFVLEMPVVHLNDFVEQIIEEFAPKFGYSPDDIKIKEIGKRAGEKDYEELLSSYEFETSYVYKKGDLYILIPKNSDYYPQVLCDYYEKLGANQESDYNSNLFSSADVEILPKSQIKNLVHEMSEKFLEPRFFID